MYKLLLTCLLLFSGKALFAQMENEPATDSERYIFLQGFSISSIGESTDHWQSFKQTWKSATGFNIGYMKIFPSDWAIVYQTGYFNFKQNDNADFKADPTYWVVPLAIGGRYYIVRSGFQPFLMAMTGFNIIQEDYTLDEKITNRTSVRLHFQVGAGIGFQLTGNLGIELNGKYNSHVLEANIPYNMTGLEYGLALNWRLGT